MDLGCRTQHAHTSAQWARQPSRRVGDEHDGQELHSRGVLPLRSAFSAWDAALMPALWVRATSSTRPGSPLAGSGHRLPMSAPPRTRASVLAPEPPCAVTQATWWPRDADGARPAGVGGLGSAVRAAGRDGAAGAVRADAACCAIGPRTHICEPADVAEGTPMRVHPFPRFPSFAYCDGSRIELMDRRVRCGMRCSR